MIYNIRSPMILWHDKDYDSILNFFFLVLWQFTDLNTLTTAWTPTLSETRKMERSTKILSQMSRTRSSSSSCGEKTPF